MRLNTIFAYRGAELIESLRKKQVKIQAQREEEILQKIKQKMDRIKANQQKLQPAISSPKQHYQGMCVKCVSRFSLFPKITWQFTICNEIGNEQKIILIISKCACKWYVSIVKHKKCTHFYKLTNFILLITQKLRTTKNNNNIIIFDYINGTNNRR